MREYNVEVWIEERWMVLVKAKSRGAAVSNAFKMSRKKIHQAGEMEQFDVEQASLRGEEGKGG